MKIAFKIPMANELASVLLTMSDKDAGAAFKAALAYHAGEQVSVLSPGAMLAFAAMRELIDLSRMKSAAGRAGGNAGHFSGKHKQAPVAGNTAENTVAGTAGGITANNPGKAPPPEGVDVLAGLDAFA
jgi:hypothetical protein